MRPGALHLGDAGRLFGYTALVLMSPVAKSAINDAIDRDSAAGAQLMELFYPELKRLAKSPVFRADRSRELKWRYSPPAPTSTSLRIS
jgi:hypothetical protein